MSDSVEFQMPSGYLDVKEPEAVPAGPYDLQVIKAEIKPTKKGGMMLATQIAISEHPNAPNIFDYLVLPTGTEHDEIFIRSIRRAAGACGVSFDKNGSFKAEDFLGAEFRAKLTLEDSEEYGLQNRIQWPKLAV